MTLEEYEREKNGHTVEIKSNYFRNLIIRTLLTVILVFSVLIVTNFSTLAENFVKKYLFQTDFKFSTINTLFNKYFLELTKFKKKTDKTVNLENALNFESAQKYKDGISLTMDKNDSVSLIESGIVVFIGKKEGYNQTVIVQQSNGVDAWYGNIDNIEVSLYDYVEKNTTIGTSNEKLYLVFQKNGEYVEYKTIIE